MFEKMLDEVIRRFGFEDERTIAFAMVIEECDEFTEEDRIYVEMHFCGLGF